MHTYVAVLIVTFKEQFRRLGSFKWAVSEANRQSGHEIAKKNKLI